MGTASAISSSASTAASSSTYSKQSTNSGWWSSSESSATAAFFFRSLKRPFFLRGLAGSAAASSVLTSAPLPSSAMSLNFLFPFSFLSRRPHTKSSLQIGEKTLTPAAVVLSERGETLPLCVCVGLLLKFLSGVSLSLENKHRARSSSLNLGRWGEHEGAAGEATPRSPRPVTLSLSLPAWGGGGGAGLFRAHLLECQVSL